MDTSSGQIILFHFGDKGVASPECWVTLGAIAAKTDRIKFGPMVSPIGFRNPAILANMACTVRLFQREGYSFGRCWMVQVSTKRMESNFPI